jgi:hypothetical protein
MDDTSEDNKLQHKTQLIEIDKLIINNGNEEKQPQNEVKPSPRRSGVWHQVRASLNSTLLLAIILFLFFFRATNTLLLHRSKREKFLFAAVSFHFFLALNECYIDGNGGGAFSIEFLIFFVCARE